MTARSEDLPSYTTLNVRLEAGVAHLQLNRPASMNSINHLMACELRAAATWCDDDPRVRAVLLSGAGAAFCSGGDLKVFHAHAETLPDYIKEMATEFHIAISRLARMDAPVIAMVQGAAAGAGMSMVCACDLVVAADTAWFTMSYSGVGLSPDGSSTYFLPRLVGLRRAQDLMLTNRVLSADEAREWGVVTEVVTADELEKRASDLAGRLAAGPAHALAGVKQLLHEGWNESLESQMDREVRTITGVAHTQDAHEGIAAFVGKRTAEFRGE